MTLLLGLRRSRLLFKSIDKASHSSFVSFPNNPDHAAMITREIVSLEKKLLQYLPGFAVGAA